MSAITTTAPSHHIHTRGSGRRGGRGRGGKGGNQNNRGSGRNTPRNNGHKADIVTPPQKDAEPPATTPQALVEETTAKDSDEAICWICAEPVKYYSISECNHRTCHVCALRLRALYKKTNCAFCKEPQQSVIYTTSDDAEFTSFDLESMMFKDTKLSIYFETREMMEETLILLRFNCPDPDCDYIGNGWGDLKLHVRATHGKFICDLCIRSKKVFSHEHALYAPNLLPVHLPSMQRQSRASVPKDQIEGGVHPLCEFCRECFFDDDGLYSHMREKHEECFICKRNEVRDQYFQDYPSLENHFNKAHHPCNQAQCLARKFVVFNTVLDLQAHMVDEHGGEMSTRDKKEARRIQADFEFEEIGRPGRRDRGHWDRDRDREPPHTRRQPQDPPASQRLQPRELPSHQRPEFQEPPPQQRRQPQEPPPPTPPIPPGLPGAGRRREFGGALTVEGGAGTPPNNNNTPNTSRPASPPRGDMDPAVLERHAMVMARLQSVATNQATAVPVVKAAVRGYRASESSARDLISTIWNVLDQNLEHTASIVNAFVDLLDQEEKKQDLLTSWKGFAIEQRKQFPDLVPASTGSGWAAITSGRVLNAKNSTATRSAQRSSRQVWDRVAQAAGSSTGTFPALQPSAPPATPAFRQPQRITPWSASASSGSRPPPAMPINSGPNTNHSITVVPDPRTSRPGPGTNVPRQAPPKLSNSVFPELPTSVAPRQRAQVSGNISLKNVLGNPTPPSASAWQQTGSANENSSKRLAAAAAPTEGEADLPATTPGKSKKSKGKQKQTLFTLGTFPS